MQRRVLRYSVVNFALAGRQNLNPLTLGVGDEIKAHARVLANNATHLFMKLVGGVKVVHDEGDMGVFAAILVGLNASTNPGELDFEGHAVVAHERIGPRAIARIDENTIAHQKERAGGETTRTDGASKNDIGKMRSAPLKTPPQMPTSLSARTKRSKPAIHPYSHFQPI